MSWDHRDMDRMFHPQVVAVVGDRKDRGHQWLTNVSTLQGKVYSVQVDEKEIPHIEALGIPNYKSLLEIPEPVDYVIVTVPRAVAPRIMKDAIQAKAGAIMFFTSGFAETGEEEGIRLQGQMTEMARQAELKVVGPNCMGIFNPKIGLRQSADQYSGESGNVGFISQSGTHANLFSTAGYEHGIRISKSVSFGNGIVLDVTDYLEYLGQDEETEIIAMYVEGAKDGRRFFRALKEAAARKPVVIWKGGRTEEGARAALSHTAALASPTHIWNAMARQSGAIMVDSFDELIDTVKGFLYIGPSTGRRMGLVAMTGGQSVVITDAFAREGLNIPALTQRSYDEYGAFYSVIGGSYRNPLDMSPNSRDVGLVKRILTVLGRDEHIDAVCYEVSLGLLGRLGEKFWNDLLDMVGEYRGALSKPFFAVLTSGHREKEAIDMRKRLFQRGVAAYPSFHRAARAYRNVVVYYTFRQEVEG